MKKNEAINFFGNQQKVAAFLKINRSAVCKWGENIPPLWAYRIEKLTKGKLKANDPWLSSKAA